MIQTLLRMLPQARGALSVRLTGINGFTGRGSVRYAENDNGGMLTITLTGVAGRSAEVFAHGESAGSIAIINGRASATFSSAKGDKLPALKEGAEIDIRQNGEVVLQGVLTRA